MQVQEGWGTVFRCDWNSRPVNFAGVWGNHADKARHILESGDVEEALNAASAIGDDRLQRRSQGTVVPDAFTHGTSEQRVHWFNIGLTTGDTKQCNTFSTQQL